MLTEAAMSTIEEQHSLQFLADISFVVTFMESNRIFSWTLIFYKPTVTTKVVLVKVKQD